MGPSSNATSVLTKSVKLGALIDIRRRKIMWRDAGGCRVKMKGGIGVMCLQAKECW